VKLFDKLGRLLTKTSLDSEFTTDGESKIRVSDRDTRDIQEEILLELKQIKLHLACISEEDFEDVE